MESSGLFMPGESFSCMPLARELLCGQPDGEGAKAACSGVGRGLAWGFLRVSEYELETEKEREAEKGRDEGGETRRDREMGAADT